MIPVGDNKFAALNTAVWSGGSFIYVPKGVKVDIPLQAYFRINTENMGQFERTLIIVDEDSYVHYVEGCTAPIYSSDSLHSAVVEIIVKKGARCRYTTIQNWSNNVYNLVTKRAVAHEGATMEWIDGNIGSKVTMKYPAVYLLGEHAKGETLSVAFAGEGQHQDAGAKMVHAAPNTSCTIISKSVARGGGRTSYRGLVQVNEGAHGSRSTVKCDALLVDDISRSDTYPYVDVREDDVSMGHEATVSQGQRRPAVLPDEPRHDRGRGHGDDRARIRRADRARAAHGVRARAQPPDRAADGRGRRLMPATIDAHSRRGLRARAASKGERLRCATSPTTRCPTGREEDWRFTPMRGCARSLDGADATAATSPSAGPPPEPTCPWPRRPRASGWAGRPSTGDRTGRAAIRSAGRHACRSRRRRPMPAST